TDSTHPLPCGEGQGWGDPGPRPCVVHNLTHPPSSPGSTRGPSRPHPSLGGRVKPGHDDCEIEMPRLHCLLPSREKVALCGRTNEPSWDHSDGAKEKKA